MKKSIINTILFGVAFTASTALANNSYPIASPALYSATSVPIAGYTAYLTAQNRGSVVSSMYMNEGLVDNFYRGEIGEHVMHAVVEKGGWHFTESRLGKGGPQGLDGLYVKYDRNGNPSKVMITDAKYGSSKLGMTLDGKQMSRQWIAARLKGSVTNYQNAAEDVTKGKITRTSKRIFSDNATATVRLKNGKNVTMSKDSGGNWLAYPQEGYSDKELSDALLKHAAKFEEVMRTGNYKSRVYNIKANGNKISLEWYSVDNDGNEVPNSRRDIYKPGVPKEELREAEEWLIDEISKNEKITKQQARQQIAKLKWEDKINRLNRKPWFNVKSMTMGALSSGASAAAMSIPVDVVVQLLSTGNIDWLQVAKHASIMGSGVLAGHVAGNLANMGVQKYLLPSKFLQNNPALSRFVPYAGPVFGGLIASVVTAYGLYLSGEMDFLSAVASGVISAASAAIAYKGLLAAASLGTAGTGVPISSLSGAAATNAGLARLGGGPLAVGGFGIRGGLLVIGAGAFVVTIPIAWAFGEAMNEWDIIQEGDRIKAMLDRRKNEYQI